MIKSRGRKYFAVLLDVQVVVKPPSLQVNEVTVQDYDKNCSRLLQSGSSLFPVKCC